MMKKKIVGGIFKYMYFFIYLMILLFFYSFI